MEKEKQKQPELYIKDIYNKNKYNSLKYKLLNYQQFILGAIVALGSISFFQLTQTLHAGVRVETKAPNISQQFAKDSSLKLLSLTSDYHNDMNKYQHLFFKDSFDNYKNMINTSVLPGYFKIHGEDNKLHVVTGNPKLISTFVKNGIVNYQYAVPVNMMWGDNFRDMENGSILLDVIQDPNDDTNWLVSRFIFITDTMRASRNQRDIEKKILH